MESYLELCKAGMFIVPVIAAAVEYIKKTGVEGRNLLYSSMAIGILIGLAYGYFTTPPADSQGWFSIVLYGLTMGLTASGLYDAGKSILANFMDKQP